MDSTTCKRSLFSFLTEPLLPLQPRASLAHGLFLAEVRSRSEARAPVSYSHYSGSMGSSYGSGGGSGPRGPAGFIGCCISIVVVCGVIVGIGKFAKWSYFKIFPPKTEVAAADESTPAISSNRSPRNQRQSSALAVPRSSAPTSGPAVREEHSQPAREQADVLTSPKGIAQPSEEPDEPVNVPSPLPISGPLAETSQSSAPTSVRNSTTRSDTIAPEEDPEQVHREDDMRNGSEGYVEPPKQSHEPVNVPMTMLPSSPPVEAAQSEQDDSESSAEATKTDTRIWESRDGRQVTATYLGYRNGTIGVSRADGKEFWIPLERLSANDRRYIFEQETSPKAENGDKPALEARVWTDASATHHTNAAWITTENDRVTLLKQNGAFVVVAINRLSERDRQYVEEKRADRK